MDLPCLAGLDYRPVAPTDALFGATLNKMLNNQAMALFAVWEKSSRLTDEARRKRQKRKGEYEKNPVDLSLQRYKEADELVQSTCKRSDTLLKLLNGALKDLGKPPITQENGVGEDDCVVQERVEDEQRRAASTPPPRIPALTYPNQVV